MAHACSPSIRDPLAVGPGADALAHGGLHRPPQQVKAAFAIQGPGTRASWDLIAAPARRQGALRGRRSAGY